MAGEQQEEQGPQGLRAHVKDLERDNAELRKQLEAEAAELALFRRERAFGTALAEAKVEGVTLADVGDLPPEQITPTLVKAKAAEKEDQRRAQIAEQAKALGFETVEEYQNVLAAVQRQREEAKQEQATAAAVATSGPGQPPQPKAPALAGWEAHEAARARGVPKDYAEAEFVGAVARQFLENEGRSAPAGGRT